MGNQSVSYVTQESAVAASILTAIYHILKDGTMYQDLGCNHFDRRSTDQQKNAWSNVWPTLATGWRSSRSRPWRKHVEPRSRHRWEFAARSEQVSFLLGRSCTSRRPTAWLGWSDSNCGI